MGKPSFTRHMTSGNLALALWVAAAPYMLLSDNDRQPPSRDPQSVADTVAAVRPGTVHVVVKSTRLPNGQMSSQGSQGSGFIIDGQNGYVITNNHVIASAAGNNGTTVDVILTNGTTLQAKILGRDTVADLAVLKVDSPSPLPEVRLGNSDTMRVGDSVIAIGNPFGLVSTTTTGIISAVNRDSGMNPYADMLQTDASINSGNSGGALFNKDGEVIGVNTAIFSPSPTPGSVGIGFSIPSNRVAKAAAHMIAHGDVKHAWLGIGMNPDDEDAAQKAGLDSVRGVAVAGLSEKGPAETAGLKKGDIILSANGQDITSPRSLSQIVIDLQPGSNLDVVLWRDGAEHKMTVKLGDYETLQETIRKEAEKQRQMPSMPFPLPEGPAPLPTPEAPAP